MATLPVPPTQAAAAVVTSTNLNVIRDSLQFLLGSSMTGGGGRRPFAVLRQTVAQAIPTSGTFAAITMDTEDADYDSSHSTVTNTDRFTAVTAGWHLVMGGVAFAGSATGRRGARYAVNGTAVNASEGVLTVTASAAQTTTLAKPAFVFLNVADFLTLQGLQESGGSLNTVVSTDNMSSLVVAFWGN